MYRRLRDTSPLIIICFLVLVGLIGVIFLDTRRGDPATTVLLGTAASLQAATVFYTPPGIEAPQRAGVDGSETACSTRHVKCRRYALGLLNAARVAIGAQPLSLDWSLSRGDGCVGAVGHARAMMLENDPAQPIWHVAPNPAWDYASFNGDMEPCVGLVAQGQNIGLYEGASVQQAILSIHQAMMTEPHDPAYCATFVNHACNILSRAYTRVGIGFVSARGAVYITWDFAG